MQAAHDRYASEQSLQAMGLAQKRAARNAVKLEVVLQHRLAGKDFADVLAFKRDRLFVLERIGDPWPNTSTQVTPGCATTTERTTQLLDMAVRAMKEEEEWLTSQYRDARSVGPDAENAGVLTSTQSMSLS